jgi:hypothetical protein
LYLYCLFQDNHWLLPHSLTELLIFWLLGSGLIGYSQ